MILNYIFIFIIFSLLILFFIPKTQIKTLNYFGLFSSSIILILSTFLLINFKLNTFYFQYLTTYNVGTSLSNINFSFGLDGISLLFFFFNYFFFFFF